MLLIYTLVILFGFYGGTRAESSYILIGTNIIRADSEYKIAVQVLKPDTTLKLQAQIDQKKLNGTKIVTGSGSFDSTTPPQNSFLTLKTPATLSANEEYGSVYLTVFDEKSKKVLLKAPSNENTTALSPNSKTRSVFVQTDKYKYKPGDKVRFRVVIVNSQLRPQNEIINVYISDPNGNRIKQWTNSTLKTGVFGADLALANKAPLGVWIITIDSVSGLSQSKNFEVEEYVLPTYEVKLIVPSYIVVPKGNVITVSGSLEAKYTFGGSVPGKATLTLQDVYGYYDSTKMAFNQESVQVNIDAPSGEAKFDMVLDLSKQPNANDNMFTYGRPIKLSVAYLDSLSMTGRNASQDIKVYDTPVKLSITGPPYYKPKLSYTLKVKASRMDDSPLQPQDPRQFTLKTFYQYKFVDINVTTNNSNQETPTQTVNVKTYAVSGPEDSIYITIDDLKENLENINFEASYFGDKRIVYHSAKMFDEPVGAYIKLTLDQSNQEAPLQIGGVAKFKTITNLPVSSATILAESKGAIVYFEVSKESNSKEFLWAVPITSAFIPNPTFVVYALYKDQIIADSLQTKTNQLTDNSITITLDADQKKPGEDVTFTVKSQPESLVCLLGVDRSVKLLAEGNDITQEDISNEIESYQQGGNFYPVFRRRRSFFPGRWWPSSGSSAKIFQDAGLFVLTDAMLYESPVLIREYAFRSFLKSAAREPIALSTSIAMAADRGSSEAANPIVTRKEFPETWIWIDSYTDKNGQVVFKQKVPDTLTTWVTTGLSINPTTGLSITESPNNLRVVIPFFVSLNLPYSVVRGETVKIQAIVYNYLGHNTDAQVQLAPHPSFKLTPGSRDTITVNVPSDLGASAYFTITPLVVGNVVLKVTATSGTAGDSLEKLLLVKAEGETQYFNKPFFVNVQEGKGFDEKVNISWDKGNMVPGSNHLEATVIGDIIGPSLSNIGNLIRMPYGCGEQNMLNFAPNIYIYLYLKARSLLTPQITAKIMSFTEQGYQRQLTYQRNDGSFSAFGNNDPKGSLWLTSFVVRSFSQAHKSGLVYIDPALIGKALAFIISQQATDGAFRETGEVHHKPMQGGASEGIALTAFTYLALKESQGIGNSSSISSLAQALAKAETYLKDVIKSGKINEKPYELSIVAYAMLLAGDQKTTQRLLRTLKTLAIKNKNGHSFWKVNPKAPPCPVEKCYYQPVSLDFEATSYVLLSYAKLKSLADGLSILRWLVSQRSSLGGYSSTQDTIVAMQALSEYAALLGSGSQNVVINVAGDLLAHEFTITPANALVLDTFVFQGLENVISVSAKGTGTALIQISWSYNVVNRSIPNGFEIDTGTRIVGSNVQTDICFRFLGKDRSNMAILEVNSPSGFVFASESTQNVQNLNQDIKLGELDNGATKFNIYFTSIPATRQCLTLTMNKVYEVQDLKPSLVKLSDYYQPELKGVAYICPNPSNTTKC